MMQKENWANLSLSQNNFMQLLLLVKSTTFQSIVYYHCVYPTPCIPWRSPTHYTHVPLGPRRQPVHVPDEQ